MAWKQSVVHPDSISPAKQKLREGYDSCLKKHEELNTQEERKTKLKDDAGTKINELCMNLDGKRGENPEGFCGSGCLEQKG